MESFPRVSTGSAKLTVDIPVELRDELKAQQVGPYSVKLREIVARGIRLALDEIKQRSGGDSQ